MYRIPALASAPALCIAAACPAHAAETIAFDVPAGPLDRALVSFATQARVSIDAGDPALRAIRVKGLKGRFTVREGLQRLLRGTAYDFAILPGQVIRITAKRRARAVASPAPTKPLPVPPPPPPRPIIVTATKQNATLDEYPGSVHVADLGEAYSLRFGARGSEVLLREMPNLSSTDLGSGRNKIFIRGIADSSFNGQTQSTISQYLGESRLIYSAPDPDLALYDVERIEVVEGPQGTLYGAGSLGGVIRIDPRKPQLGTAEFAGTAALSVTGNEVGLDGALVGNVPLGDNAAARLVAYHVKRPGYIDDLERNLSDINRTSITGLRATIRWQPTDRVTLDAGLVGQNTGSRDGQYTDSGTSALTRRSFLAQPFDNDYRLAFVTGRIAVGAASLVTNTAYADHSIDTVFDATSPDDQVPSVFMEGMQVSLISHETRLSGSSGLLSNWVAGVSLARNVNNVDRRFGNPDDPQRLSVARLETVDGAIFGEATAAISKSVSITAGSRISYVRQSDEFDFPAEASGFEPKRSNLRLLPTLALSWKPWSGTILYARYQEGFRPGAQQVTGTGLQTAVTRFDSDDIRTAEVGLRFGNRPGSRLSGGLSYAHSRWNEVQADLVTTEGFPYIDNLGSGFVRYASADLTWKPVAEVSLEASGFLATSHLDKPEPAFQGAAEKDLPNVADSGWRLTGRYEPMIGDVKITFDASIGYVGTSYLAIGAPFDLSQGDYLDTSMGARVQLGDWGLSVDVENLLNSRANRFSYGNPFSLARGMQQTPLVPRTVRIGIDARY